MSVKYRKISPRIWSDIKFRSVSDDAQLLFLFILTHPHMSSVGAIRASIPGIATEKGWEIERTNKGFAELFQKGLLKHDISASAIIAPNFIKYNPPENPNVVKAWRNAFDELPECELIYEHFQLVKEFLEEFGEGFRIPFRKGISKSMPNQEQEQEQEQEQKDKVVTNVTTYPQTAGADLQTGSHEKKIENEKPKPPPIENCPHQEIIKLYHETLPMCPQVREWHEARRKYLKNRWAKNKNRQHLDWWKKFFEYVAESKFLIGEAKNREGMPAFIADLEWLIRPTNFTKVIEGKYHQGKKHV